MKYCLGIRKVALGNLIKQFFKNLIELNLFVMMRKTL